eukprot:TRINITY_DN32568_c0_g1_i1.p1 TRINITY_DN32568_c0_g1~~TRINITY_DN32568_c0_g1_i1.p1  ORF type:complete len:540 (-),score=141.33 TRINITY_DN32568_c0_g1_i1:101-1720(-)
MRREIPPPRAAPKGLAGLLEGAQGHDPDAILDLTDMPANMVYLNVYDVSENDLIQRINKFTTANNQILVGGVFHGGIEIFGREWSYGCTEDARSGVGACLPRGHPQHTYRATVPMGATKLDEKQVMQLMMRVAKEWPGNTYNLIHNNCITFCNVLLEELGLRRVPGWVDRAARTASAIDRTSKHVASEARHVVNLVRTVTADLEDKARELKEQADEDPNLAFETLRRDSIKLAEKAQTDAEALAAKAQEQAQELSQKVEESVQAILNDESVKEFHKKTSEHFESLSATFMQWGQDLGTGAGADARGDRSDGVAPSAEVLQKRVSELGDDLGSKVSGLAGQLFKAWGQPSESDSPVERFDRVGVPAGAASQKSGSAVSASDWNAIGQFTGITDLLTGLDDVTSSVAAASAGEKKEEAPAPAPESNTEDRGTSGVIRAQEDRLLTRSLLDDDSEDEAPTTMLPVGSAVGGGGYGASKAAPKAKTTADVEAPADWLSAPLPPELSGKAAVQCQGSTAPPAVALSVPKHDDAPADADPFDLLS